MAVGFRSFKELVDAFDAGQTHTTSQLLTASISGSGNSWCDLAAGNVSNSPAQQAYPGTALTSTAFTSGAGFYQGTDVSPSAKFLANIEASATSSAPLNAVFILCDYLLYYPGIALDTTSPQTLTNSISLTRYTSGVGVKVFAVLTTIAGVAANGTYSMTYTNSDGTPSRTSQSFVPSTVNIVGSLLNGGTNTATAFGQYIPLQAGDKGIQSIQSFTCSSATPTSGRIALVLCKPLLTFTPVEGTTSASNAVFQKNCASTPAQMPRIYDGAYLHCLLNGPNTFTSGSTLFTTTYVWS